MSFINRISIRALCLALPAGAFVAACGAEGPATELSENDTRTSTATVERIDIGDGAHLEFMHDERNGLMTITAIGPENAKEKLAALGEIQGGLVELHRAALPGRDVPANVLAFDAKMREVATEVAVVDQASTPLALAATPGADNGLGNVTKSAASFPGQFCNDQIDRVCNVSGWYLQSNGCFVNSTGDWSRQLNTVRQGFAAIEVYRGTVTLRSEWWNGFAWVVSSDTPINQGFNSWRRLFSTTASPHSLRFGAVNAAGDGYHIGIQSADTPIMEMANKELDVGQLFNVTCQCTDGFRSVGTFSARVCLSQPTEIRFGKEWPTHPQADATCVKRCDVARLDYEADLSRTSFQAIPRSAGCQPINPIVLL
jgi:hypothetical protein